MEHNTGPSINQSANSFYNRLTYNGQSANASNSVFDSGGQARVQSINVNELSGLRLIAMVCPITIVFLLAVTGNLLVIATLAINRRMRTAFNAFLLNMAVADLLLGIFCMPFTVSGFIMKQFIFGSVMCKLIPYLQAVAVTVSSWTLVTMSVERVRIDNYYAICQPLKSKSYRQSSAHVYKVIGGVWLLSLIILSPIAYLSELQPTNELGKYKCRENWPSDNHLIAFTIFLDIILFVIPLFIMIISYFLIALQFISLEKQTVMHLNENDGQGSYQATTTRSSIDATYADGDTFMEGTQSQTNNSLNYQAKTENSPVILRNSTTSSTAINSPLRLGPIINGRTLSSKTRHRSTSPNTHELLSAKSSINKPKTISFSSSLENMSLDGKEIINLQNNDLPTLHSPSIFTTNDEHSSVFKTMSINSRNSDLNKNVPDSKGRSPIKSDRPHQSPRPVSKLRSFSLRKKDKNNNLERIRKPSSSTISSSPMQGSNDNSLFVSTDQMNNNNNFATNSLKLDCNASGDRSTPTFTGSNKEQTAMKLRSSVDRNLAQKRQSRVIKMLAILVLEFFVCWTPLHCVNLISLYKPKIVYEAIGYNGLAMFLVLAYASCCSNPITYCFMNSKFRSSFLTMFGCCRRSSSQTTHEVRKSSQVLKPKIRSSTIEEL